jgi:PadR family transcriptional regulator, regulatory protein PadR
MDDQQWPGDWMRGVLSLCVLAVVAEEETYGYAVAQRLQAAGLGTVKGGTLYPVLTRLEQDGLLTSTWREGDAGPGRKFFSVTRAGRTALQDRTASWLVFTERATDLLTSGKVSAS